MEGREMKIFCKDGHYRKFYSLGFDTYYFEYKCEHCNRKVMTVPMTAGSGYIRRKLRNKNHICKARLKELK